MIFIFENDIVSVIFETRLAQMSNNNQNNNWNNNIVTYMLIAKPNKMKQTG
jgi:hypothetical protein